MEHADSIRLAAFLGLFALFALAEAARPRRDRALGRWTRWRTNWGVLLGGQVALRLLALALPLLAVGAALDAEAAAWGLFNVTPWPAWLEVTLAVIVLDLAIWAQHLAMHRVPWLWRLHRVHHADRDVDVTTALRFHPGEIALSMLWKVGVVYALGASALAVVIFEIVLNGLAMFNHANLGLSARSDALLRRVVVTPDMHRVHHSVHRDEHNRNYGFCLSAWDHLFRTYRAQPQGGHRGMTLGLEWQDASPARLFWSLALPFRR
ncbi:sterol desaturase family protein [Aquicoccus sp. SCR17]|nr:sterol desaturase family protein [Carideicomes alvinocaridis]